MRDLPSRDEILDVIDVSPTIRTGRVVELIRMVAVAYAEGRLFDREAIDYEAIENTVARAMDEKILLSTALDEVAAAIGDGDE